MPFHTHITYKYYINIFVYIYMPWFLLWWQWSRSSLVIDDVHIYIYYNSVNIPPPKSLCMVNIITKLNLNSSVISAQNCSILFSDWNQVCEIKFNITDFKLLIQITFVSLGTTPIYHTHHHHHILSIDWLLTPHPSLDLSIK